MRTYVIERRILFPALANVGSVLMVTTIGNYGDPTRMKTVTFSLRALFPTVVWKNITCASPGVALLVSTVIYSKSVHTRLNLKSAVSLESINYWIERRFRLQTMLWSCSINNTFCSIIKSSLLTLSCRLLTIVQLGNPPVCVDSGTNFEQLTLQNIRTRQNFDQTTWTRLTFR